MNKDLYSNHEFSEIIDRLNHEILRRGTYKWWDPLTLPSVGIDRTGPVVIPTNEGFQVDDKTYTINNPSTGSIEETRNATYQAHGLNPSGKVPDSTDIGPNTSAAAMNTDELRNLLVGLTKIQDVNLFYGRDELKYTAYRDPNGIEEAVNNVEKDKLNALLHESDISPKKIDPNGGNMEIKNPDYPVKDYEMTYPMESGKYVMPSGESDGEEIKKYEGLGVTNFYDDYGANPGDSNFHPYNRFISERVNRDAHNQNDDRETVITRNRPGGVASTRFGTNPRNPEQGDPYPSREVYGGKEGACNVACTGMCFMTCDNECSESCTTTCFSRCGNACTSSCGNVCTGCSTQCFTSCKTKCENSVGYSCVKAGAKTLRITSTGGKNGEAAKNELTYTTYACEGCSYSCQFYPNKKTECWDSGCMGKCYISCNTACSTSCYGGCVDNNKESTSDKYQKGKGRGCSSGCTINCVGLCQGTCISVCTQTCFQSCKSQCSDNCAYECTTTCGAGCANGCKVGCTGCSNTCYGECTGAQQSRACVGCGSLGGCTSTCQFDCNGSCMDNGCRSMCGIDNAGSCESNCRMSCMSSSCTAMCSDACSVQCSTCVNTCGFQCGACSSQCSTGCSSNCNTNCTEDCSNSCSDNCVHSCTEECGGCSNLCYSCVGMCIGICSVKCEAGCSSCTGQCSWWCDSSCSRECFADCNSRCINTCTGSCATLLESNTTATNGPERKPTAEGYIYPDPKNRWEERESFRLTRDIEKYVKPKEEKKEYLVTICIDGEKHLQVVRPEGLECIMMSTAEISGVYQVDSKTGEVTIDEEMLPAMVTQNNPSIDDKQSLFIIQLVHNDEIPITDDDIGYMLQFGMTVIKPYCHLDNGDTIVIIIKENPEYFPEEEAYDEWHKDFHM